MSCRCAHLKRLKQSGAGYEEKSTAYMDYNAAAPPNRKILALYQNTALNCWAHPSSPHLAGQSAQDVLIRAEERCRRLTGGGFTRAFFTTGSTSALKRVMEGTDRKVISSCCDHAAVLKQAENPVLIDVDSHGRMNPARLEKALQEHPDSLVLYSPVNHETGALQDCRRIWEMAAQSGAAVFIDAAQAAVRLPEEKWLPYCHGFCLSAHKLYGLKGQGLMMTREDFPLKPLPHRETPDAPGALALAETLALYQKDKNRLLKEQSLLIREGWEILKGGRFEIFRLSPEDGASGVLCIALPGLIQTEKDTKNEKTMEDLFYHLNLKGLILSRFSACSGSVNGPSPILEAMGFPPELCESSLRISLGRDSTREHFFRLRKSLDEFAGS